MGNFKYMKFLFLYIFLFLIACEADKKKEGDVIARVGAETLTRERLLVLAGDRAGDSGVFSREINKWIENKLLYRAAISIGLDKDKSLTKERDDFYENLLISSFIRVQTNEKTKTTKKEVSNYYLKNKDSFKRTDDEVVVKHFVFHTDKEAKKIKKELKKKKPKIEMSSLLNKKQVKTKTIRKKEAGSNHLSFLFDSVVGDILGPKENNEKFHIFQVLQKHKKGSYLGLEMVYDEIYQRLYKEREILVLNTVLDSLYLNSDVFVSQEVLSQ